MITDADFNLHASPRFRVALIALLKDPRILKSFKIISLSCAARNDVMSTVTLAEQRRMERTDRVKVWFSMCRLLKLDLLNYWESKLNKLRTYALEVTVRGPATQAVFGKRVAYTLQEVKDLRLKEIFKRWPRKYQKIRWMKFDPLDPNIVGQHSILATVWSCLSEEHVGTIGLYGPAGVGKSMLLKQINNRFCDDKEHHFDFVM